MNGFPGMLTVISFALAIVSCGGEERVTTAGELESLFSRPLKDAVIRLAPGYYYLSPKEAVDSTCGNCVEPDTMINITYGLRVSGRNVVLSGPADGSAVIHTHSGYGIYFLRCDSCRLENLTITGGERDTAGAATDAAVVVKHSRVTVTNVNIHSNIGDSARVARHVSGVMGIAGREGAFILILNNRIVRNSWDGIALYRGASAVIRGNLIDGIDKATGRCIGGGRGVGIGLTWNSDAVVEDNLVKRYWKGIGVFVDAQATVRHNIIEDIVTWGIAFWDAGKGKPVGEFEENVVYNTGACGASLTRSLPGEKTGSFRNNIIAKTGQNSKYDSPDYYCYQMPLARHAVPESFVVEDNLFLENRRATDQPDEPDLQRDEFIKRVGAINAGLEGNPYYHSSYYANDYGFQQEDVEVGRKEK